MTRINITLLYQILEKMCGGVLWIPKKEANVTETIREDEKQEGQVTWDGSPEFCSKLQMVIYHKLAMSPGDMFDGPNLLRIFLKEVTLLSFLSNYFKILIIKLFRRFF